LRPVSGFWKELMRRRVPLVAGAWCVGGWILLQAVAWAVGHWVLSPRITDLARAIWLSSLPAAGLLAWAFGKPGRVRWTRPASAGVILYAIVAGGLLYAVFRDRDFGPLTSTVTVIDEEGRTTERSIPTKEATRTVAVFAFVNESEESELDWLQVAAPWSLVADLEQDDWIRPIPGFAQELGPAGPFEPSHLSLSRQREAVTARFMDYLVVGSIGGTAEEPVLTTRLYEAGKGTLIGEHRFEGAALLDLVDLASIRIRKDLKVPSGHISGTPDRPVRELLSESPVALRAFLQAEYEKGRDPAANLRLLAAAVGADSAFALAQGALGEAYLAHDQPDVALAAYRSALRHADRMSERSRLEFKVRYYQITRQPEAELSTARLRTELYPADPAAWDVLGIVCVNQGDGACAIEAFESGRALDPSSWGRVQLLGQAYVNAGRMDDARRVYERYADRYPERLAPLRALGTLNLQQGAFTPAAEQFGKALQVDPADFQSLLAMADISERIAEFEAARGYYDRAISASRDAGQMWLAGGRLVGYFDLQGMTDSSIARMEALAGYLRSTQGRAAELQHRVTMIALYPRAGRTGRANALLDTLRAELLPPLHVFVPLAEALLLRELGEGRRLESKVQEARQLYRDAGYVSLDGMMLYLDAEAKRLQGRCPEAIPLFERAAVEMRSGRLAETDVGLGGNPWLGLGTCYRLTGRHADATRALGESYSRIPSDARVLLQLAYLYRDMGDRTQALRYLNGAVHVWRNADSDRALANEARSLLAEWQGGG